MNRIAGLLGCRVAGLRGCRVAGLINERIARLPDCQSVATIRGGYKKFGGGYRAFGGYKKFGGGHEKFEQREGIDTVV